MRPYACIVSSAALLVPPATPVLPAQVAAATVTVSRFGTPAGVQGQPVTLVLEHKTVQTLADGTHITRTNRETFIRDSQGRTRQETEITPTMAQTTPVPHSVMVFDPSTNSRMSWMAGGNLPHEYTFFGPPDPAALSALSTPPPPKLNRAATGTAGEVGLRPAPIPQENRPRTHVENLGTQDVQGFPCDLTRRTTVFPTGYLGNDRPITTVNETCMSRELGRVIQMHITDPRMGEQTTEVVSISRAEPDASLFQPPAGYEMRAANPVSVRP
jgi:hypothetical protein